MNGLKMSNVESAEGKTFILLKGKGFVDAEWAGNMQEAIERVRELLAELESTGEMVSPYLVAKQFSKALDGDKA